MLRRHLIGALAISALLSLGACQAPRGEQPVDQGGTLQEDHADAHAAEHADHAGAAQTGGQSLKVIMQGLAVDMARVSNGVWNADYASIAAAANAVANHPHVGAEQMAAISKALGPEFQNFAAADHKTHDAAVALHEAALSENMDSVLTNLDRVQRSCVSCHTGFRDRLRPALTGQP